ncbi:MAG TPA: HNH endonuclease [Actinocrinis sp.]|nr:HNH endonuclease [Actinocrinis sp.]
MASTVRPRNRYTEDNLRPAVAACTSYHGVIRHLGLAVTGGGSAHLARRIRELGIDVLHITSLRPAPEPFREIGRVELAGAFGQARSVADLARRLGLPVTPRTRRFLAARLAEGGLDPAALGHRRPRFDPDHLRALAGRCESLAGMMRELGLDTADSANYRRLRRALSANGIDTGHFTRSSWAAVPKPRRVPDPARILKYDETPRRTPGDRLRRALKAVGVPEVCRGCGLDGVWQGRRLTLEVDHVNGDFRDNRPENLRLLCPNCHALTATYCRPRAARNH